MRRRPPLPRDLGEAFLPSDAAALGISRHQLSRPDITAPFFGVRTRLLDVDPSESPAEARRRDILHLARAYRLTMSGSEFFSHETAAEIWRLPLPTTAGRDLSVSVHHPRSAPRGRGIEGHQVRAALAHVGRRGGFAVTSPATTWAMLGARLSLADLVALGDAIVRVPRHPGGFGAPVGSPLATLSQLSASVNAGRRAGIGNLRAALPLIRTGSSSRPETHTRLLLLDARLPEPDLDVDVFDDDGVFLGCSELAYPEFRVAIEYEGDDHRVSKRQWNRDIDKYQLYAEAGWRVVRLTSVHVFHQPGEGVRRVRDALHRAGWTS